MRTAAGAHPRPEGFVQLSYDPTSPFQWGLAPLNYHVYVYRDVAAALSAIDHWVDRIWKKREAEAGTARAGVPLKILYRGQSEISLRLLPTLLRGPGPVPVPERPRYRVESQPGGTEEARQQFGDWFEEDPDFRSADSLLDRLSVEWLTQCGAGEERALALARQMPGIAGLDPFRQRAAVRHYSGAPSTILDVTTKPEVAAFFATGGGLPRGASLPAGSLGMLWAIDLTFLAEFFDVSVEPVPGGRRIVLRQPKERWGDNHKMFADQGIPDVGLVFTDVALPLPRPEAQHAVFLSLTEVDGPELPIKAQLHWWSLIERWSYMTGFIQDGRVFEDSAGGVTRSRLFPEDDANLALSR